MAGHSRASIVRTLNDQNIPRPSGAYPWRNRRHSGTAWTVQSVAAILSNPRYTGRQVWNRQHTDRDPHDRPGAAVWRRWNPSQHWVASRTPHTADEAIHSTAALLLSGFRAVVGTFWSIRDSVARRATRSFYAALTSGGHNAAEATHRTVLALRERYRHNPSAWSATHHMGI
jgi:recombinase/CHAT domain-containing protein